MSFLAVMAAQHRHGEWTLFSSMPDEYNGTAWVGEDSPRPAPLAARQNVPVQFRESAGSGTTGLQAVIIRIVEEKNNYCWYHVRSHQTNLN
jgi:hypothetical protein